MIDLSTLSVNAESETTLSISKDVKFPLMLDVYELCTAELQDKMLPARSKFKEIEDKKLEKQQQKVTQINNPNFFSCIPFRKRSNFVNRI